MSFDPAADQHEARTPTAVRWLIAVNVAVYVVQLTVFNAADMRGALGFQMRDLDGALWSVGTHMFVHANLLHVGANVALLWLFGPRLELAWGRSQFTAFYLLCGFGAWLFHLMFVRHGVMFGATGAALGIMLAYALRWPADQIRLAGLNPIGVRWLVAVLAVGVLALGLSIDPGSGAGYLAHAGGLFTSWGYLQLAGSMNIDRLRQRVAPVPDEPDEMPPRAFPRSLPRQRGERESREVDDIVAQSHAAVAEATARAPRPRPPSARATGLTPAEINSLLDKISAEGIEALTHTERKQLEEAARRLKDR